MNQKSNNLLITSKGRSKQHLVFLIGLMIPVSSAWADASVECNVGPLHGSTECGVNADANNYHATALGNNATAGGSDSIAIGVDSSSTGDSSIANGNQATASAIAAIAIGHQASAASLGSVSIGESAGFNNAVPVTDAPYSIAIGYKANIGPGASGAIAIGGDGNGDGVGAQATAPGAIALGKDVVNDVAHSMLTKVPLTIRAGTGRLLRLENTKDTVAVRTLLKLSNNGPVGFELRDTNLGDTWQFRSNPDGKFIINRVGNPGNEFVIDGDGNGNFIGEVKANGILLTSSRASKTDIRPVQPASVMEKLSKVEVAEWRYKKAAENDRHISPMAEDFYSLFQLGRDNQTINPNDLASVAIVATKELQKENSSLNEQLSDLDKRLESLEKLANRLATASGDFAGNVKKASFASH